ncbi:hypothetical protein HXX76_014989 [Chlamydomonas incerta]|uniref:Deoxyhypusine synthase n=1 Tax=Chlamydomonas incerta TaxID=51695 RepID=A0A835SK49_CHLIN|nr:hypothetical protein HXX76_014989 [Chlamydomonas incerta]|eukprot:KAG2423829.1 hypothetical protein HXX76_014989 [Chlamydomonas incerta]
MAATDNKQGREAVLCATDVVPSTPVVKGFDFATASPSLDNLMAAMLTTGFQATSLGQAVNEVNRMINWRLSDEPVTADTPAEEADPAFRANARCIIFLGYTSNFSSAGTREQLRWLAQNRMVDVMVTTAGGIEEDFIKCMAHTYLGDFALKGEELRDQGLNRIGNMIIPNANYCKFEDWIMPILDAMLKEQNELGVNWTPSKIIARLGKEINDPSSTYYWAYKNNIPVFSPAITDGSIGDMIFFHGKKNPGLRVDIAEDVARMNDIVLGAGPRKTAMLLLGGGVPKHHICNANLMRNGADFAVYLNTAQEFDGSDSGARPDEAISWGKIRVGAQPVKVYGDATVFFPLLLSQTFAKNFKPKDSPTPQPRPESPNTPTVSSALPTVA